MSPKSAAPVEKATAAKSLAKAGSSQQVLGISPPVIEGPPQKKARSYTEDERAVHNAHTYMKRMAEGRTTKATEDNVADAKQAMELYSGLTDQDRLEFAKKVESSKSSKNYQWVRTFKETLRKLKRTTEGVKENYYTRTLCCCQNTIQGMKASTKGHMEYSRKLC